MKKFTELTKTEKRVAIAKDVLKQIQADKFRADNGYFSISADTEKCYEYLDGSTAKELQPLIKAGGVKCNVCAIGALFASQVVKANHFKAKYDYIGKAELLPKLKQLFSPQQLGMIEAAFEQGRIYYFGTVYGRNSSPHSDLKLLNVMIGPNTRIKMSERTLLTYCLAFDKNSDLTTRMINIMKNIIKNKGYFVPFNNHAKTV